MKAIELHLLEKALLLHLNKKCLTSYKMLHFSAESLQRLQVEQNHILPAFYLNYSRIAYRSS